MVARLLLEFRQKSRARAMSAPRACVCPVRRISADPCAEFRKPYRKIVINVPRFAPSSLRSFEISRSHPLPRRIFPWCTPESRDVGFVSVFQSALDLWKFDFDDSVEEIGTRRQVRANISQHSPTAHGANFVQRICSFEQTQFMEFCNFFANLKN